MNMNAMRHLVVAFAGAAMLLAGCGEDSKLTVTVRNVCAAGVEIPPSIKKVAMAEFTADNVRDARYGEIASDKFSSLLDKANREHGRYQLMDRRNLKRIMDERDLQVAIGSSDAAIKAGKIANVDAIVFGSVKVKADMVPATKTEWRTDANGNLMPVQVPYQKYQVTSVVHFTMTDVRSGGQLATDTLTETYDSDKDKQDVSFKHLLGMEGRATRKTEIDAANILIEKCVSKFVRMISPTTVSAKYKLSTSKNKMVDSGNKMAAAGDYEAAVEVYKEVLSANPADDGACFNIGLVCEAQGKLDESLEYYGKAVKLKPDSSKYIEARARVRACKNGGPIPEGDTRKKNSRNTKEQEDD